MDFVLVIIEHFSLRRYEWKSIENRRFRRNGFSFAQNFRYKGRPPPIILRVGKLREWPFHMV